MMLKLEKSLTLFIGIGTIGGAVMMWIDPTGVAWGGASIPLATSILCSAW